VCLQLPCLERIKFLATFLLPFLRALLALPPLLLPDSYARLGPRSCIPSFPPVCGAERVWHICQSAFRHFPQCCLAEYCKMLFQNSPVPMLHPFCSPTSTTSLVTLDGLRFPILWYSIVPLSVASMIQAVSAIVVVPFGRNEETSMQRFEFGQGPVHTQTRALVYSSHRKNTTLIF